MHTLIAAGPPALSCAPGAYAYGALAAGQTAAGTFTPANTGGSAGAAPTITLTGSAAGPFPARSRQAPPAPSPPSARYPTTCAASSTHPRAFRCPLTGHKSGPWRAALNVVEC